MECCKIENKCLITALLATLLVFLVAISLSEFIDIKDKVQTTENTITVSGTGTIYAKPDLAITTASVVIEAKTVVEAMQENTEKMNAVIGAVKELGVENKDLKTTGFNIFPRYEWYEEWQCSLPCPGGKRVLVGYEVRQSLQIKMRDLDKIGAIIQAVTDAGANEISDLQFTIDEEDALKAQARAEAISKAKAKAKELAKELGVRLVRISNFSENGAMPYYVMREAMPAAPLGKGGGDAVQIETGENKIEVQVSITYEIK